jgi:protein gp37
MWLERLEVPLRWQRPRVVFVNSMSDLFHEDIPDEFVAEVFDVMVPAKQRTLRS